MTISKDHVIKEIQRTAQENGGIPLGLLRFTADTGIRAQDCIGVYWTRWSDAVVEAGLKPNEMTSAYDGDALLRKLADLAIALSRVPVKADMQMMRRRDSTFPSYEVYIRRFGSTEAVRSAVAAYCAKTSGLEFAAELYASRARTPNASESPATKRGDAVLGYVYLLRHGTRREYKIGRTNSTLRRLGEINLELPHGVEPVHTIATDDPPGIEAYWHKRFAEKRKNGEWFELNAADVSAFKRRKYM